MPLLGAGEPGNVPGAGRVSRAVTPGPAENAPGDGGNPGGVAVGLYGGVTMPGLPDIPMPADGIAGPGMAIPELGMPGPGIVIRGVVMPGPAVGIPGPGIPGPGMPPAVGNPGLRTLLVVMPGEKAPGLPMPGLKPGAPAVGAPAPMPGVGVPGEKA